MAKQPRGIRNNNPLNIKHGSKWRGLSKSQTDKTFCQFDSMTFGLRAAFILMRNHINGFGGKRPRCNTIFSLISVWAPSIENDSYRYAQTVAEKSGISMFEVIDFRNRALMVKILRAMAYVECGLWLEESQFLAAYDLI